MNNIAALLDTPSLPKKPSGGGGGSDGGLFADTFKRQMREATAPESGRGSDAAARGGDAGRSGPARDAKESQKPDTTSEKGEGDPATEGEAGKAPAEGAPGEASGERDGAGGEPSAREGKAEGDAAAEPPAEGQPTQTVAEVIAQLLSARAAQTESGAVPAEAQALPFDAAAGQSGAGRLARELGLRLFSGPAQAATGGEEGPQLLPEGEEAPAAADAPRPFERVLDSLRLAALRPGGGAPSGEPQKPALPGPEAPPELLQTTATARAEVPTAATAAIGQSGAPTGSAPPTAAAGAPQQLQVPENLRHQGWQEAFSQRLTWAVKQGVQEAQVQLNPRELGPVEVRISVQQDQAQISFVAAHATTREALEQAMPRLRDMLSDAGINLAQSDVSGQPFAERQAAGEGGGEGGPGGGRGGGLAGGGEEEASGATVVKSGDGLLDYYA